MKNETNLLQQHNDERLFHLLQFLTFIKTLKHKNSSRHSVEGKHYIIQEFYLNDFMRFIGVPITQKHRTKIISYFQILHKSEPITQHFSDGRFSIFASFLFSGVKKISNRWIVRVYIIEDLYNYSYPFILSKSFKSCQSKTDCFLKLKIIRLLSVSSVKKIFPLSEFIKELKLSNAQITKVKKDFIFLLKEINQKQLIENKLILVPKDKKHSIQEFNLNQLEVKHLNSRILYMAIYEKIPIK